jgi:hypothetical protein
MVMLDLRELRFIDSTGLRLILEIDAMAREDGFNFALVRGARDGSAHLRDHPHGGPPRVRRRARRPRAPP